MKINSTNKYKHVLIIKGTQGMARLSLAPIFGLHIIAKIVCRPFSLSKNNSDLRGLNPRARRSSLAGRCLSFVTSASLNPRARRSSSLWLQLAILCVVALSPVLSALLPANQLTNNIPLGTEKVSAAPADTLNFQGRLMQASGALVPDGIYNMEFNLYNVSSGGSTLWTEDRLVTNTQGVTVVNGYFSVYLGDYDALPAIDWSQELWLGMTVRGTASCLTWGACTPADSEMSPRFKLTAVPFAFTSQNVASGDTNAVSTPSSNVTIQTGDALGATSNSGNIGIDVGSATGTAGTISLGSVYTSALNLGRNGITTTNAGALTVSQLLTANGGLTVNGTLTANDNAVLGSSTADTLTVEANATFNGSLVVSAGDQFTNAGSTLFTALAISDVAAGGNIGSAATTVDVATTFNVNQTTAGQTLTLPNPTSATSGRIAFVNNVGSASFNMYGSVIGTGKSNAFIWNGSAWVTTVSLSGSVVNVVGTLDSQTKSADGAVIAANAIYLQTADVSNPGLVSIGAQTFNGVKTFDDGAVVTAGGLTITAGALAVNSDSITSDSNLTLDAVGYVRVGDTGTPTVANGDDDLYVEGDLEADGGLNVAGATIQFGAFTTDGLLKTTGGNGTLAVATAGTDYELPLTFNNGLTRSTNTVTLGGALNTNTTVAAGNSYTLGVSSDLSGGARSTATFSITQANDASNNSTGALLNLTNSDTGSTTGILTLNQSAGGIVIDASGSSAASAVLNTPVFSTGTAIVANIGGNATSAAIISLTSNNASVTNGYTGSLINLAPTRTVSSAVSITESGSFLNLNRTATTSNAGATYNLTGDVAKLSSNCTQTSGTCTDSSNILSLTQSYTSATGETLLVTNAGTGASLRVNDDGTESDSSPFIIDASGSVGIGDATPAALLTVGSSDAFQVNNTGDIQTTGTLTVNGNTTIGNANTDTLTINAGSSGTGILFADDSFNSCVLTTSAAGVLTCAASGSLITLQSAYDGGNSILSTNARDIDFTLANTATDSNFLVDIASGSTGRFAVQSNGTDVLGVRSTELAVDVNTVINGQLEVVGGSINSPFGGFGLLGNGLASSEALDDVNWTATNITVTADNVTSPNLLYTDAERLVSTAANGALYGSPGFNSIHSGTFNFSIWMRGNAGGESVDLRIDSTGGTPTTGTAQTFTLTTEWKRYWVTQTFTGSVTYIEPVIEMNNNAETIYAWGGQLTESAEPGVYTPTRDGVSFGAGLQETGALVDGTLAVEGNIKLGYGENNQETYIGSDQLRTSSTSSFDLEVSTSLTVSGFAGEIALTVTPDAITDGNGGTILAISAPTAATTQLAALTGQSLDLSTNLSVPNSANGNQTGLSIALQDGGASATAIGVNLLGTGDTAINFGGTYTNLLSGSNVTLTNAGALTLGSTLTANGNTTIGNANTDTLTINAGVSGTGISFGDASFATCSALETVAGVLTCGTDADSGSTLTLQGVYDNDTNGSDAVIALTSTDGAVILRDAASTIGTLFAVEANGGSDYLSVASTGTTITGPSGGSQTALTVNVGSANNVGLIVNGASSQSVPLVGVKGFGEAYNSFDISNQGRVTIRPTTGGDGQAFTIMSANGLNSPFYVDTSSGFTYTFSQNVTGSITLSSFLEFTTASGTTFTTPQGASVGTKINVPLYNVGSASQIFAFGLPVGAASNSRALSLFDNRAAGDNQPVLAVLSPDETDIFGLSSDGSNAYGYLKASSGIGLGVKSGTTVAALFETSGNTTLNYDLAVNGGDITTASGDLTITPAGGDTNIVGNLDVSGGIVAGASNEFSAGASGIEYFGDSTSALRIGYQAGIPLFGIDTDAGSGDFANVYLSSSAADAGTTTKDSGEFKFQGSYYNGSTNYADYTFQTIVTSTTATDNYFALTNTANTEILTVNQSGNTTISGDLAVNGDDLTTTQTTFNLLNGTATTVNAFGAATSLNLGVATGYANLLSENLNIGTTGTTKRITSAGTGDFYTQTAAQSTASTNSGGFLFGTGSVSGATSNSGYVNLSTGNSTTSGDTGSISILSGNATSGNSGYVTLDAGSASGAAGGIQIGNTYASGILLGRSGITTTNAGALTVTELLTANGNIVLQTGDTLTVNGDAFTDLTGAGLIISSGALTVDTTSATGFFQNGGNSFAGTATLGTNDNNSLILETNNTTALTVDTSQNVTLAGNLAVNGTAITTDETGTFSLLDTNATTINAFGDASSIIIGAADGTTQLLSDELLVGNSGFAYITGAGSAGVYFGSDSLATSNGFAVFRSGDVNGAAANSGAVTLQSGNSSTSGNTGIVSILSGNATSGNSGGIVIDTGTATGTVGSIDIGTSAVAKTLTIGNSTGATGVNINTGSNGYDLASTGSSTLTSNGSITITAGGGSTWSTSSGTLTVGATAASATLGLTTGSGGTIEVGINNTSTINVGSNSNIARTINIGTSNGSQAQAITIGSTSSSASSLALRVGTGNFTLDGAASSTYTLGASTTTGTIAIGGTAQTGNITLGSSSGTSSVLIGNGAGASTVNLANVATTGAVNVGTALTSGSVNVGGAATFKYLTNSATAFQVQNASSASLFTVDTTNNVLSLLGNNSGEPQAWQSETDLITAHDNADNAVIYNGYIYVAGGDNHTTPYSTVAYAKLNANGSTEAWSTTGTLSTAVTFNNSIEANGYLYVLGGSTSAASTNTQSIVQYAKINPDGTLGAFTTTSSLTAARKNGSVVTLNGYMYYIGGDSSANATPAVSKTVYFAKINADGTLGTWANVSNSNAGYLAGTGSYNQSAIAANGYIYVIGGNGSQQIYYARPGSNGDITSNFTLEATNGLPGAAGWLNQGAHYSNGYLYIVGGSNASTPQSTVYYAPLNANGSVGTWAQQNTANDMPAAKETFAAGQVNGYLYAIGGYSGGGALTSVYYTSLQRIKAGGNLDLTAYSTGSLTDPSGAGSLTAGDTLIVGTLQVQGPSAFNGDVTVNGNINGALNLALGTPAQAGTILLSDGSSNTLTIATSSVAGNYTLTIPTVTANDNFCLVTLGNCSGAGREFTAVVGTSVDSSNVSAAGYVANGDGGGAGDGDQVEINAAITAVNSAGGGKVLLLEGTYTIDATIDIKSDVELVGSGQGATIIKIANGLNTNFFVISESTNPSNFTIRDLSIDANESNNTGTQGGIAILTAGSDSGATSARGALIENVEIHDVSDNGIYFDDVNFGTIADNHIYDGATYGIWIDSSGV